MIETVIDTTIRSALASAVADVLERMFFLEGLGEAAESPVEADTAGCFQMRLARPAASAIAADFLGEAAESLTGQQIAEVALELANMICGAVLSRIESNATFHLGAPKMVADVAGWQGPATETRYTVETGSGTLTAVIQMETRTCSPTQRYAS